MAVEYLVDSVLLQDEFKSRLVFGEVIVFSGGRAGTCTVAAVGKAAVTPLSTLIVRKLC